MNKNTVVSTGTIVVQFSVITMSKNIAKQLPPLRMSYEQVQQFKVIGRFDGDVIEKGIGTRYLCEIGGQPYYASGPALRQMGVKNFDELPTIYLV